jgi:glyoxylase-like metal-dependent hydrolase (beta-lactamase superfamily II)
MQKWKTKNGYEIFRVSAGRSHVFLISTGKGNLLVDTGWKSSFTNLRRNIGLLQLSQPISYLILTHTHFDHCYNAAEIRHLENCKIVISEHDAAFTRIGYTTIPGGTLAITRALSSIGKALGRRWFGYPPFNPDRIIGEDLDLSSEGYAVKIISTPGHTKGSVTILIDHEIAIVGDTLIGLFRNSVFPPFADDQKEMIRSWEKLLETECHLFLPGHGREITRKLLEKEYDKYSG